MSTDTPLTGEFMGRPVQSLPVDVLVLLAEAYCCRATADRASNADEAAAARSLESEHLMRAMQLTAREPTPATGESR